MVGTKLQENYSSQVTQQVYITLRTSSLRTWELAHQYFAHPYIAHPLFAHQYYAYQVIIGHGNNIAGGRLKKKMAA